MGGTITDPAMSPVTVNEGDATTITAVANVGYTFTSWSVVSGSADIANAASPSTTATLNTGDAVVRQTLRRSRMTLRSTPERAAVRARWVHRLSTTVTRQLSRRPQIPDIHLQTGR